MIFKLSKKGKSLKEKGEAAYLARKWKKALECFDELRAEMSLDPKLHQRIGELHRRLEQNKDAVEIYKKAARLYAMQGFWAKAIAVGKLVLEINPRETSIREDLSRLYSAPGPAIQRSFTDPEATEPAISPEAEMSLSGYEPHLLGDPPKEGEETIELDRDDLVLEDVALGTPLRKPAAVPLLSAMSSDEVVAVLDRLAVRRYPKGSLVCEEGDIGKSMYILADGVVEVFTKDAKGSRITLGRLCGGDFFGEFGLLTDGQRNASVQALTDLELLEITEQDFRVIEAKHPKIWVILEEHLRKRLIGSILAKSPVFRALRTQEKEQLTAALKHRRVSQNETVMEEGSDGSEMFFVKTGALTVTVRKGRDKVVVGELKSGDYFGEVAMLTGKPRTATVTARSDAELFCLSRGEAARVLKENREILLLLKGKMDERAKESANVFESYREAQQTLVLV